jgi:hypothetical protein
MAFLVTFFAEPTDNFIVGDQSCPSAFEDFFSIGNMVFVTV